MDLGVKNGQSRGSLGLDRLFMLVLAHTCHGLSRAMGNLAGEGEGGSWGCGCLFGRLLLQAPPFHYIFFHPKLQPAQLPPSSLGRAIPSPAFAQTSPC